MHKAVAAVLVITAGLLSMPAHSAEHAGDSKVMFEVAVKLASDDTYLELVQQAWSKGWRFTPEQIEAGSRRHFEEFKLQLIDQGYTILPGEAGSAPSWWRTMWAT